VTRGDRRQITTGPLRIEAWRDGENARLDLSGELDASGVQTLYDELQQLRVNRVAALILDLSDLEFIDSAGIVLLIDAHRRSQSNGKELRIVRPTGHVAKLLTVAGLDDVLPFVD
jgi:anti-sigma B factor antagonist